MENKEPKEIKLRTERPFWYVFLWTSKQIDAFMIKFFELRSHYLKSVVSFWYSF
jgi:hypothetical protein